VPKTLLIADDSASMRLAVRYLLQGRHPELRVREAVDGLDAIEMAKRLRPDLILLDLAMPQLNGAEAAAVLKNSMPETPVVLFTLNTDLYTDAVCEAIGVDFISKVDGLPKLLERVDALLPPPTPPNESLQLSEVRILVVDDFALFRIFVVELLGKRPELQVVGEASDGLEAVQKAVELKPDVILMDLGLPSLNGIEAARRIRKLVPESKIIFLSQESSADVVQAALSLGGRGYVTKTKADADLFAAVEAVLAGKTFVSNLQATANFNFPLETQFR
jgi:DNA-binding NarL/FixJ family response regulator